jgi:CheY-like chemotaxis protein
MELPRTAEPPALRERRVRPSGVPRDVRVLVVEDNRDSAESLRALLELAGYRVSTAYSGSEGIEAARAFGPHVVLCDIGLPGMDGFTVAETLRRTRETASAKLIAVTGYGQEADRERALGAGFDRHLVKPVDPEVLLLELADVRA